MIKEKDYCVVLIKDFEDRLKISLPENQNYDCIEIDTKLSISDEEFLEKTKNYNKFIFVLEIASIISFSLRLTYQISHLQASSFFFGNLYIFLSYRLL